MMVSTMHDPGSNFTYVPVYSASMIRHQGSNFDGIGKFMINSENIFLNKIILVIEFIYFFTKRIYKTNSIG